MQWSDKVPKPNESLVPEANIDFFKGRADPYKNQLKVIINNKISSIALHFLFLINKGYQVQSETRTHFWRTTKHNTEIRL